MRCQWQGRTSGRPRRIQARTFFDELVARGHEPLLQNEVGTLRFDLVDGRRVQHWYVSIDRGDITVSDSAAEADTVLRTRGSVFDRSPRGRLNALAAVLRGELVPEGDCGPADGVPAVLPRTASFSSEAPNRRTREEPAMSGDLVQILEGNTFVVSDDRGDIEATLTDPTGLFSFDTRFLSRWVLTVNGDRLNALSTDDLHYYEARFFLVPGTGTVYIDSKLIRPPACGRPSASPRSSRS